MPAVCAAVGCFNSSRRDSPFHVHAFPSDPRIAKLWVSAIQRDNFKPSKWIVLCSAHFTADAYEDKVWLMKNMGMEQATTQTRRCANHFLTQEETTSAHTGCICEEKADGGKPHWIRLLEP